MSIDFSKIVDDISTGFKAVDAFTGNTSNQSKSGFESYRQAVWDMFARLVDAVSGYRNAGQLDRQGLQMFIDAVARLAETFRTTVNAQYMSQVGSSYVSPRFHDYYDFMMKVLNDWRTEILTLPVPSFIDSIIGGTNMVLPPDTVTGPSSTVYGPPKPPTTSQAGFSTNTWLILAAAAAAVMFLGHKQRSE